MPKNLSKEEIISLLAENLELPQATANEAFDHLVGRIKEYLATHKEITVSGFGSPITIRQKGSTDQNGPHNPDQIKKDSAFPDHINRTRSGFEQRKLKRRNFILDIEIVDRATGMIIGDMGDITAEGIMVVSDEPIAEQKSFSFEVRLPDEADEVLAILFEAQSIRCQETIHENIYVTGFKITSLDEENRNKIEFLIREYAV